MTKQDLMEKGTILISFGKTAVCLPYMQNSWTEYCQLLQRSSSAEIPKNRLAAPLRI